MTRRIVSKTILSGGMFRSDDAHIRGRLGAPDDLRGEAPAGAAAPGAPVAGEARSIYRGSQQVLARLIGLATLCLPVLMWLVTPPGDCPRLSISHHYYVPFAGTILTGILIFTGGALVAYRGDTRAESLLANLAGLGAIGTALFPIPGTGCAVTGAGFHSLALVTVSQAAGNAALADPTGEASFRFFGAVQALHNLSAGALFGVLGIFCIFVFTRVEPRQLRQPPADGTMPAHVGWSDLTSAKQWRNAIYIACGLVIFAGVLLMGANLVLKRIPAWAAFWQDDRVPFFTETAMLWAFGLSWALKGRLWVFAKLGDRAAAARAATS